MAASFIAFINCLRRVFTSPVSSSTSLTRLLFRFSASCN